MYTSNGPGVLRLRFPPPTPDVTVHIAPVSAVGVPRLIEQALGPDAADRHRSPRRSFPLQHHGRYFSISHTPTLAAVAVSTAVVGVDIEQLLPPDAATDMAWALTGGELLEAATESGHRLTEIWTAKEAAGKALGIGVGPYPNRIETRRVSGMPSLRRAQLLDSEFTATPLLTVGSWLGHHHLRVAWISLTDPTAGPVTPAALRQDPEAEALLGPDLSLD